MKNQKTFLIAEGAVCSALAILLSLIPIEFGPYSAFNLSLGMIPVSIYAVRRGVAPALAVGLVWGLLHFAIGKVYFLTMPQFLLDYILAFTATGLFGVFSKQIKASINERAKPVIYTILSAFIASFARHFFAFLSGGIFFGEYAPEGFNGWIYSLAFNGLNALANFIMLSVVISIIIKSAKNLIFYKTE
ncbi:MAG: energy-coupled thiamine transporter ThiT [Clostridiales Family XIII bacterium]|nr:energy-coupled thiamine transporter ThiT [Clostridiales Family XIII bacterium]